MPARANASAAPSSAWSGISTERSESWRPISAIGLRQAKSSPVLLEKYQYEQIGQGRLTNVALIAMGAGRLGITVITANERDFGRLAEFRSFHWQVSSL